MSTPQDPHGGDSDWGRPPAGGWGAVGPSDPTADPPTPAFGTPAVGPEATGGSGSPETPRYGWEAAPGGSAAGGPDVSGPDVGGAGVGGSGAGGSGAAPDAGWAEDRTAGWSAGGTSDWDRGGAATGGWDRDPAGRTTAQAHQGGWSPETGQGEPVQGGWSPETGATAAWDPHAGQGGGAPGGGDGRGVGRDPQRDRTGGSPQGGWNPGEGSAESAAAATTALTATGASAKGGSKGGAKGGGRLPLLIGGIVAVLVVAAVLVLGFWRPGFFVTQEFDQQALQTGVTQILTQDYGLEVTALTCPDGQRVAAGESFTCAATVDGENVDVPITVLDDQGTYQVGRV